MKKNVKEFSSLLFFIIILFLMLINYNEVIISIKNSTEIWLFRLFPSLFPFMVIGSILINLNIGSFIKKYFKINNSIMIMLLALISGFPSNAKYTKEMLLNKSITLKQANDIICFSFFANPLFLLSVLSLMFSQKITLAIIISHYIANFVIYFFMKDKNNDHSIKINHNNLGNIISLCIKDCVNTMLLILGTITFYNIIISLLKIYISSNFINCLITGVLEFSSGLNSLINLNTYIYIKAALALLFISFGSLSIHSQIKSILIDTNISYKRFFCFRIIHVLLAIFIFTILYFL